MKISPRLYFHKVEKPKILRNLWKYRGRYRDPPLSVPKAIKKLGVTIHDPVEEFMKPKQVPWKPPVDNDPEFIEEPSLTDHPLYKEHPAFSYTFSSKFLQKEEQACALTKTVPFEGLPENVSRLINKVDVPDKEKLLQHHIMHSQEWISTRVKLPRRQDKENLRWVINREYGVPFKKSIELLLTNLIRMCQITAVQFPSSLTSRRLISRPFISTHYMYKGDKILMRGHPAYMLGSDQVLQPFVNQEFIDQSKEMKAPDVWPLIPTVDLPKEHLYDNEINSGFKIPYVYSNPHTLFMANTDHWGDVDRQSRALMFCFAFTMTRAKAKYGESVKVLPEPISVQCVNMSQTTLNFTCFQLNTLDIDSDEGAKNFVWFDTGNQMYDVLLPKPWRKTEPEWQIKRYIDFRSEPFDKMLALILNGIPETANL